MAIKKKLYYKRIIVDVVSETPIPDNMTLGEIEREYNEGKYVGSTELKKNVVVTGRKAAKMVMDMGSNPAFFQMNEFGNEVEED